MFLLVFKIQPTLLSKISLLTLCLLGSSFTNKEKAMAQVRISDPQTNRAQAVSTVSQVFARPIFGPGIIPPIPTQKSVFDRFFQAVAPRNGEELLKDITNTKFIRDPQLKQPKKK